MLWITLQLCKRYSVDRAKPIISFFIRYKFSSFSMAKSPTCDLQIAAYKILVCSCAMSSNCVWLQIIFCSCINETRLFSFLHSLLHEKWQIASRGYSLKNKLSDQMIKQLLNLVIAKYCDLSLSHHSIICLSLQLQQIIY